MVTASGRVVAVYQVNIDFLIENFHILSFLIWKYYINRTIWKEYGQLLLCLLLAATCDDGIRNQGEVGVDCGGPCEKCSK